MTQADDNDKPDAGRTDDLGQRVLDKVTWEWQRVEDLIRDLIPAVPPGKALRTYQNGAKRHKGVKPAKSEDEQIASGARQLLNARLGSHRDSGRITVETRDGERWVKFNERRIAGFQPGDACPTCGGRFPATADDASTQRDPVSQPPRGVMKDGWARAAIVELTNNDQQIRMMLNRLCAAHEATSAAIEGLQSQLNDIRDALSLRSEADAIPELREMVEVLEAEVNTARVSTAGVVETTSQLSERVTDVESSLVRLVSRLSGAVSAKEVFQLEREH